MIVAGRSALAVAGQAWRKALGDSNYSYSVYGFGGECSHAEIARIVAAARQSSPGTIVGAGGGKVLDAARAAAADLNLPVVNCPTVASSDAPCSALSVIYTDEGVFQEARFYAKNPELVLVDTEIVARAPARLLAAGMGDALATWFEARTCVAAHRRNTRGGASTRTALALAELCYRTLMEDGAAAMQAVSSKAVTPAFERIVEANTLLSGLGFESSGLAAAHAVHNGFTVAPATHRYFHGEKVAFGVIVQLVLEGAAQTQFDEVFRFSHSVGLPVTLNGIGCDGIPPELLQQVAARSTAPGETIHNEPFEVTPEMVADAILAADAAGRNWQAAEVC
jgi:glycerol dehydrogenase